MCARHGQPPSKTARRSRTTRAGKAKPAGEPSDDSPTVPRRGTHPPTNREQPRAAASSREHAASSREQPRAPTSHSQPSQPGPSYFVRIGKLAAIGRAERLLGAASGILDAGYWVRKRP